MKRYGISIALIMVVLAWPCLSGAADRFVGQHRATAEPAAADVEIGQMPGFPVTVDLRSSDSSIRGVVLADLDGSGELEVVFSSALCSSSALDIECEAGTILAWDSRGNLLPGFPVATEGSAYYAPSVGDLDGDGDQEIVQITSDFERVGRLYVVDHHGSILPGFPVPAAWAGPAAGATLSDLDHDGKLEIVYASMHEVHVFEDDGSQWSDGWPVWLETGVTMGLPTIGDVDDDGSSEIFVLEGRSLMHLLRTDGSEMRGWPRHLEGRTNYTFWLFNSAAMADLDGDLDLEIIISAPVNGRDGVHVLHHDGRTMAGWPQGVDSDSSAYSLCSPLVTDLEGDGEFEILFAARMPEVEGNPSVKGIFAWDASGALKPGFPYQTTSPGLITMLTAADYDGDGMIEVFSDGGHIIGIDANGVDLPGFPLDASESTDLNGAIIGDVDGNGRYEIAVVTPHRQLVNLYTLPAYYLPNDNDWLTFHAANSRGGLHKRQYRGWRFVYSGGRQGGNR